MADVTDMSGFLKIRNKGMRVFQSRDGTVRRCLEIIDLLSVFARRSFP